MEEIVDTVTPEHVFMRCLKPDEKLHARTIKGAEVYARRYAKSYTMPEWRFAQNLWNIARGYFRFDTSFHPVRFQGYAVTVSTGYTTQATIRLDDPGLNGSTRHAIGLLLQNGLDLVRALRELHKQASNHGVVHKGLEAALQNAKELLHAFDGV